MSESQPYLRDAARRVYRLIARSPAGGLLNLPLLERVRGRVNVTRMSAADVLAITLLLKQAEIEHWLIGGWGLDALLGEQTRPHADLDLVIRRTQRQTAISTLRHQGFLIYDHWSAGPIDLTVHLVNRRRRQAVELHLTEIGSESWTERLRALGEPEGLEIDTLEDSGMIEGHRVSCLSAVAQLTLHLGYDIAPEDRSDVALLCSRFGLPCPTSYRRHGHGPSSRHLGGGQAPRV
jgi:lincosamide nucleotidyltransferase A/C/D/E